jgi:hypothetical protein
MEEALLEIMVMYGIEVKDVTFQYDNDPKHTAKTVKKRLSERPFKVLD